MCTIGWQYLREGRDPDPAGTSLAAPLHERGGGKLKEGEEGGEGEGSELTTCTLGAQCWFGSGNSQGFPLPCLGGRLGLPRLPSGGRLARWFEFLCLTRAHNLLHNRREVIWYMVNSGTDTCPDLTGKGTTVIDSLWRVV